MRPVFEVFVLVYLPLEAFPTVTRRRNEKRFVPSLLPLIGPLAPLGSAGIQPPPLLRPPRPGGLVAFACPVSLSLAWAGAPATACPTPAPASALRPSCARTLGTSAPPDPPAPRFTPSSFWLLFCEPSLPLPPPASPAPESSLRGSLGRPGWCRSCAVTRGARPGGPGGFSKKSQDSSREGWGDASPPAWLFKDSFQGKAAFLRT